VARRPVPQSAVQRELLRLLRPLSPRLAQQPGERARPALAEIAQRDAGRPAAEVLPALAAAVRAVGAEPDMAALAEFAEQVEQGENPFA
jgi:hypothetical protein